MKVFCIGFHKTGTTSMKKALEILGFDVCGTVGVHNSNLEENIKKLAHSQIDGCDAFQDNPWPVLYEEIDRWVEDSKFILTCRDEKSWLPSVLNQFGEKSTPMREYIYGVGDPSGNEEVYLKRYKKHNKEVREYFQGRKDFLEFDIEKSKNRCKLICNFLNKEVPEKDFPHANETKRC